MPLRSRETNLIWSYPSFPLSVRLRLSWHREAWYVFLLTKRRSLPFPESLRTRFPPFWYFGKREPAGIDLCWGDFDVVNDLPHVFCYRFVRKFEPGEYRLAVAEYTWSLRLYLQCVNTLLLPRGKGRAYRWCWYSRTPRFSSTTSNNNALFIVHVADIESVSTSSMTYCVIINVQIILIRVVERAQSKTTLYEPV